MTAHRPLLTAVAAGSLLCAVWCVPSAQAGPARAEPSPAAPVAVTAPTPAPAGQGARLADSGSVDTTPYVLGGCAFLVAGGALVTVSVRRSRTAGR
ncbi:hypothetical protein ACFP1Z_02265 [Streptomyces gamaensis]|uniref:LPXTG cell wall anchor domain-containing protein n=1 Tax=Streptomyces gamaensis TaxID=1763542 RepID=A0ABW0YR27_9ACTN